MKEKSSREIRQESPYFYRIGAALAGAALVAGGCRDTPTESASEGPFSGFEPRPAVCDADLLATSENPEDYARGCLEVYGDAEIAMVNFVLDPQDAEKIAESTEEIIITSTDGMIQPKITVIAAGQEAKDALAVQTAEGGCIDGNTIENYSSFMADATMPELAGYDMVAGVSDAVACAESVSGFNNAQYSRYFEVFEARDDETAGADTRPLVLAHEALHSFDLGHFGSLESDNSLNDYLGQPVDLPAYIKETDYDEYGDSNVMGNPSQLSPDFVLTSSQQYFLEWPQHRLGQESQITALNLAEQSAVFTGSGAAEIAILDIDPYMYSIIGAAEGFNRLILEPQISEGVVEAIEVLLVSKENNIASLGLLHTNGVHELRVGDGTVSVDIADGVAVLRYRTT